MKKLIKQPSAHWQISKLANLLIFLRPANLLIFKFANLLIFLLIFTACSKSDEPEVPASVQTPEHLTDWTPQPKIDVAQPYMAFATGSTSATTLSLTAVGATVTATDVWVDTNNNGIFEEGTDVKVTDFSKPVSFTAANGLFTVYGKVTELNASGNALTAADVRSNEALTKLNIADNWLEEKDLLDLVKSLPTPTDPHTAVVLHRVEGDGNKMTEAVLIAAKERGWQALKIEGGSEVPDLPADKEAPKAGAITEATATAFNSVLVKWTAATDDKTAAEKLRYQVLYNVQGSGEVKTSEVKENMLDFTLTGLAEKTTYIVKVKVLDEAGNATDYEAKEVTTPAAPEAADTEAPKAGAITEATTTFNSLSLKWTAATDNKTAAEKLRYQVLYEVKGSGEVKTSELTENRQELTLTGLAEKTTYIIKVKVMDEANNAAEYEAKEVTTAAIPDTEAPTPATIKKIEKLTYDKVKITWLLAQDNETPQTELRYQVFWRVKGTTDEKSSRVQTNIFEYTLTDLKGNTTYEVWVKVWDNANLQAQYPTREFTTDKQPGPYDALDKTNYIELTTDKPVGETIKLSMRVADKDKKGVWIDLNNNGQWDKDIDVIPQEFGLIYVAYTVKAKTFKIYGRVTDFRGDEWTNQISKVVWHNPALEVVFLDNNKLTSLTVPNSEVLKYLVISNNPLTSLHIGKVPNLEGLYLNGTNLTSLDISPYGNLKELFVSGTPLTRLDASKNPLLKEVGIRRDGGKGLIGTPLEDFIESLPAGKGIIYLNEVQKTPTVVNKLLGKDWDIR